MNKKNRTLVSILLVLTIGLIGLTIAYFSNSTSIENEFKTKPYGTTVTEEFVSPDNWLPGDTTDKTVTVTNSGQVDEAVRISLTESWTPNNSNATLNGWIHADGTKSNHTTEEELATDVRAAVINFTENSDWTKVGDYYYYNYKLAPGQTTDSLIESVKFNALTKLGDTCITSSENGIKTITCNSSGEDYDHATYKLTINIETVQYNKYQEAWSTNFAIASEKPLIVYGLNVNRKSKTYETGDKHQMFEFEHLATDQTPALTDYRYIGNDPYNYVYFNCDSLDNQNSETCEVWRIIGVFDVDDGEGNWEQRLKLVRSSALVNEMRWDDRENEQYEYFNYGNTEGKNDWNEAKLNIFLNGDYLFRQGDAVSYGLKALAQSQISYADYYLGLVDYYSLVTPENLYNKERGNILCTSCGSDTSKIKWTGKVGLLYSSDEYMVYAKGVNDTCYINATHCSKYGLNAQTGWIYNGNIMDGQSDIVSTWLLNSVEYSDSALIVNSSGVLMSGSGYDTVRPVVYLKSSINIIGGEGTDQNPYTLSNP